MRLFLIVLILIFSINPSYSKAVKHTEFFDAVQNSSAIIKVEVIGFEFDDLKTSEIKMTENRFFLGKKYRVLKILKKGNTLIKKNDVLDVRDKSNTCLVFMEKVSRRGKTLIFERTDNIGGITEIKPVLNKKYILFLDDRLRHYGWFASPKEYSEELEMKIKKEMTR